MPRFKRWKYPFEPAIKERVKMLVEIAKKKCKLPENCYPEIEYEYHDRIAGSANASAIFLNPFFIGLRKRQYIKQTVAHEVAHFVVNNVFRGAKPHGREWRFVMLALRATPKRCHTYGIEHIIDKSKDKRIEETAQKRKGE